MVSEKYYKMETQTKICLRSDQFLDWLNGSRYNIKLGTLRRKQNTDKQQIYN